MNKSCVLWVAGVEGGQICLAQRKKNISIRLLGVKCCQLAKCNLSAHKQEMLIYCRGQKMCT